MRVRYSWAGLHRSRVGAAWLSWASTKRLGAKKGVGDTTQMRGRAGRWKRGCGDQSRTGGNGGRSRRAARPESWLAGSPSRSRPKSRLTNRRLAGGQALSVGLHAPRRDGPPRSPEAGLPGHLLAQHAGWQARAGGLRKLRSSFASAGERQRCCSGCVWKGQRWAQGGPSRTGGCDTESLGWPGSVPEGSVSAVLGSGKGLPWRTRLFRKKSDASRGAGKAGCETRQNSSAEASEFVVDDVLPGVRSVSS